jgi:hypothetical protein
MYKEVNNGSSSETVQRQQQQERIYQWHVVALILHGVQSIVLFGIANPNQTIPVTRTLSQVWGGSYQGITTVLYSLHIEYLPPLFLVLAASNHALALILIRTRSSPMKWDYCQPWMEYFFSASVMNVLILSLCNGTDLMQHLAVFGLTATTMLFGILHELVQPMVQKVVYWCGCIPFVFAWTIILFNFGYSTVTPPSFVYAVIVVMLLLESSFAINQMIHIWSQKRYRYELIKIFLSLLSKSALAWLTYGGARSV